MMAVVGGEPSFKKGSEQMQGSRASRWTLRWAIERRWASQQAGPDSTTYVASLETAEEFGYLLCAEALE